MESLATTLAKIERLPARELKLLWRRMMRKEPPSLSSNLLRLHLAHVVQEKAEGGLSMSARQRLRRLRADADASGSRFGPRRCELAEGTRLVREWRGQTYVVEVTAAGLIFNGRVCSSLTSIADEITGGHWPGPAFFGLYKRTAKVTAGAAGRDR